MMRVLLYGRLDTQNHPKNLRLSPRYGNKQPSNLYNAALRRTPPSITRFSGFIVGMPHITQIDAEWMERFHAGITLPALAGATGGVEPRPAFPDSRGQGGGGGDGGGGGGEEETDLR